MDDGRGMTTAGTASDRKHILIVDDDPNELKMLRYYLKDHYKVTVISSGRTAMEFMSKYTPDLVLLDYLMPENNGAAVLKDMQSRDRTKDIPVFFLTGQTGTDTIRELSLIHISEPTRQYS